HPEQRGGRSGRLMGLVLARPSPGSRCQSFQPGQKLLRRELRDVAHGDDRTLGRIGRERIPWIRQVAQILGRVRSRFLARKLHHEPHTPATCSSMEDRREEPKHTLGEQIYQYMLEETRKVADKALDR